MSEHTKGPWKSKATAGSDGEFCTIYSEVEGRAVARHVRPKDARRIVTCVDVCEGVPTDLLEGSNLAVHRDNVRLQADNARLREAEKVMETMYKALSVVHGSLFHQPGSGYIITSCEGVLHDAFRLYEKYRGTVRAALGKDD